jgi:hypothetical protein
MTIICNTNKIVYLRPMKCASTSFEYYYYELAKKRFLNCSIICNSSLCFPIINGKILDEYEKNTAWFTQEQFPGYTKNVSGLLKYNHATFKQLEQSEIINPLLLSTYKKITSIRNPWDWILSIFCHSIGMGRKKNINIEYMKAEFVRWWEEKERDRLFNQTTDGKIKNMGIDNTDFVVRFEDFEKDVKNFTKKILGIDYYQANLQLKKINSFKVSDINYKDFYNKEMKNEVGERYSSLINKYNYQF